MELVKDVEEQCNSAKMQINYVPHVVLTKAFRGELVSQDRNGEPASILLERIKSGVRKFNEVHDNLKQTTLN